MNLVRFYHPHPAVTKSLTDELFNSFLRNDYVENNVEDCKCRPATNVYEDEKEFRLELLLAGYRKEDIQLHLNDNLLVVKADLSEEDSGGSKEKYTRREFGLYNFERQFKVPKTVATDKISAKFENGILKLTLPKKEKESEKAPFEIKIN
jgi:HSP20 family protein